MPLEQIAKKVYYLWDEYAKTGNIEGLLSLYADDALSETPLVPILLNRDSGTLKNKQELELFFREGTKRRPNEPVRWYRTGQYFFSEKTLIGEYPTEAPDGDQVDIPEFVELNPQGKMKHHKIYWGWFGTQMLIHSSIKKSI